MSRRIYSFTTGKLFESEGTYSIEYKEIDLSDSENTEEYTVNETYYTKEDAYRAIADILKSICEENGVEWGDLDMSESGNTFTVKCIDCNREWEFIIQDEYIDDYEDEEDADVENEEGISESVAVKFGKRFAKYGAIFEEEDDADVSGEGEGEGEGDENEKGDEGENGDEKSEDVMKAVVLTVAHGDGEKLKKELLDSDYGFEDSDIDVIEGEDEDENDDVKVDASKALELKKYLADKKNIDLEEKIGGEIVDDSEGDEDESSEDGEGEKGEGDEELDFDELGDIFGAEE